MTSGRLAARIGLFLGPLLFLFVSFFPLQQLTELSFESRIVLASTVWMATWWITEAIPIYVTALLPLVIFPFGSEERIPPLLKNESVPATSGDL